MITVVLNSFKRQAVIKTQIDCVMGQTVPPKTILIWNNGLELDAADFPSNVIVANCSRNLGVWSRFAFALNADTEYVCVLDDDTMPGKRFFETCLQQMQENPALIGTRGLRFLSPKRYQPFVSFGWDSPNKQVELVDIVGHAWFFKREWLSVFWREQPPIDASRLVGEDMHFSFMLQKYAGISTIVTPHPEDDLEMWGSDPKLARALGMSEEAISQEKDVIVKFDKALKNCVSAGFKLCAETHNIKTPAIVIGGGLSRSRVLKRIILLHPAIDNFARKVRAKLEKFRLYF